MRIALLAAVVVTTLLSCKSQSSVKRFEVKGTIKNNPGKMIFLEEVPMATMQPVTVDSAEIGTDGMYKLKAVS